MKKGQESLSILFGHILRQQRVSAGWSQERLAAAIGVTFQQIQKYEKGVNRISLPQAHLMARAVGFKAERFFEAAETADSVKEQDLPTRAHLEMAKILSTFTEDQLKAFKHFATALGRAE